MCQNRKNFLEKVTQMTGTEKGSDCCKTWKYVLAALGILAAVGGIIYAVYRHSSERYLEEFEDNLDGEDEEDDLTSDQEDFDDEDEDEENGIDGSEDQHEKANRDIEEE
jgi:hypothetical protein